MMVKVHGLPQLYAAPAGSSTWTIGPIDVTAGKISAAFDVPPEPVGVEPLHPLDGWEPQELVRRDRTTPRRVPDFDESEPVQAMPAHHMLFRAAYQMKRPLERDDHAYRAGYDAGARMLPLPENPYELGSVKHSSWTRGHVEGEELRRLGDGNYGNTPEEFAEAAALMDPASPDPVVEILGGYDFDDDQPDPWSREHVSPSYAFSDPQWFTVNVSPGIVWINDVPQQPTVAAPTLADLTGTLSAFIRIAVTTSAIFDELDEHKTAAELNSYQRSRQRDSEKRLLDERRRSHRRTNRWGSPPGRRR